MLLFTQNKNRLTGLKEKPFKLEKEIQILFENNLESITGLKFIKSEFMIKDKRIDTLAFNPETKAFVIIEYKRERNLTVVDQGFSYLKSMLESKGDFIVEYFETEKQKILQLQNQINRTDKEIDQMVYQLYGLTPEEIEIVENDTKN